MNIIPRSEWKARAPLSALVPFTNSRISHIATHFPGSAATIGVESFDATAARIRGYQAWHQDGRKWKDLGYNYLVDQAGRAWEGRGWNVGGHVLGTQNAISVGVCFILGNNERPTDAMLNTGAEVREWIEEERLRRGLDYVGHSDWANKLCPGPFILPWTHAGMLRVAGELVAVTPLPEVPSKVGETAAPPAFPLGRCRRHGRQMWYGPKSDLDHQVSGWANRKSDGSRGADGLYTWQARMAYRGWRITPDGLWGSETERVVRGFQAEKGLELDGAVGPSTWAAAWSSPIS